MAEHWRSSAPSESPEVAGLRAFLRSRCGGLQRAFAALDVHSLGQVTSDDFVKGVERLGYTEDCSGVFHAIDASRSGLVSLSAFMTGIGGRMAWDDDEANASIGSLGSLRNLDAGNPLRSPGSEAAWRSAQLQRSPFRCARPDASPGCTADRLLSPVVDRMGGSLASVGCSAATMELLLERIARLEARAEAPQPQQQSLDVRACASLSEQLDLMRQQLHEEQAQREAETAAMRAAIEASRTLSLRSSGNMQDTVRVQVELAVAEIRAEVQLQLQRRDADAAQSKEVAEMKGQLEELRKNLAVRLESMEATMKVRSQATAMQDVSAAGVPQSPPKRDWRLERELNAMQRDMEGLSDRWRGLQSKVEGLCTSESSRERAVAEVQRELSAQRASLSQGMDSLRGELRVSVAATAGQASVAASPLGLADVEELLRTRMEGLRTEWRTALEEERFRSHELSQVLGRTFCEEAQRSASVQALAEVQAEARAAVAKEVDSIRKEGGLAAADAAAVGAAPSSVMVATEAVAAETLRLSKQVSQLERTVKDITSAFKEQRAEWRHSTIQVHESLDAFKAKVQGRVLSDVQDLHNRLTGLENAKREGPLDGSAASHTKPPLLVEDVRWLVEQIAKPCLASVEESVERAKSEVKEQAGAIETIERRLEALSSAVQDRLLALVHKVEGKCIEELAAIEISSGTGSSAFSKEVKMLPGRQALSHPAHPVRAVSSATALRRPEVEEVKLQAARQVSLPPPLNGAGRPLPPPLEEDNMLEQVSSQVRNVDVHFMALREENMRLREENTEMREQAVMALARSCVAITHDEEVVGTGGRGAARSFSPPPSRGLPILSAMAANPGRSGNAPPPVVSVSRMSSSRAASVFNGHAVAAAAPPSVAGSPWPSYKGMPQAVVHAVPATTPVTRVANTNLGASHRLVPRTTQLQQQPQQQPLQRPRGVSPGSPRLPTTMGPAR